MISSFWRIQLSRGHVSCQHSRMFSANLIMLSCSGGFPPPRESPNLHGIHDSGPMGCCRIASTDLHVQLIHLTFLRRRQEVKPQSNRPRSWEIKLEKTVQKNRRHATSRHTASQIWNHMEAKKKKQFLHSLPQCHYYCYHYLFLLLLFLLLLLLLLLLYYYSKEV